MLKKIQISRLIRHPIFLIFFGAFILRIIGLKHGFPFIFHPDEPALVRSATGIIFDPNPAHFDWPHLHFYLNYFLYFIFIKLRGLTQALSMRGVIEGIFPILWRDPLIFYYLSRFFDALIGALTIIPIFLTGRNLFNRKVGIFAALALAIMPFHAYVSHFALIDIPMVFWGSLVLYFSSKIFLDGKLSDYLWAGILVGFSASTKYNGAVFSLVIATAHFLRFKEFDLKYIFSETFKKLVPAGILSAVGFLAGTPYAVLDSDTFLISDNSRGAIWQFTNVGKVSFATRIETFFRVLTTKFFSDFGATFIVLYGSFLLFSLFGVFVNKEFRDKRVWVILLPSFLILFYTSGFERIRAHYFLYMYPFVALIVAYILGEITEALPKKIANALLILIFAFPVYYTAVEMGTLVRKDTRVILYEWMLEYVTDDDKLVYNTSSYVEVFKKFGGNDIDKNASAEELEGLSGYIIISGPNDRYNNFEMNLVKRIDSKGRKGPDVFIYEF